MHVIMISLFDTLVTLTPTLFDIFVTLTLTLYYGVETWGRIPKKGNN